MFPYYFNKREALKKDLLSQWDSLEESLDKKLDDLQQAPPKEQLKAATN